MQGTVLAPEFLLAAMHLLLDVSFKLEVIGAQIEIYVGPDLLLSIVLQYVNIGCNDDVCFKWPNMYHFIRTATKK